MKFHAYGKNPQVLLARDTSDEEALSLRQCALNFREKLPLSETN